MESRPSKIAGSNSSISASEERFSSLFFTSFTFILTFLTFSLQILRLYKFYHLDSADKIGQEDLNKPEFFILISPFF